MISIKKISIIDIGSGETEVTLTDGKHELVCYASNFKKSETSLLNKDLHFFFVNSIERSQSQIEEVNHKDNFGYVINGQLFINSSIYLKLGEFKIYFEDRIPSDLREGEFIKLNCMRIDLY